MRIFEIFLTFLNFSDYCSQALERKVRGTELKKELENLFADKRFLNKLVAILKRIVGSKEEAEDLAQDVFLTAIKKLPGLRQPSFLQTWVIRIGINKAINRRKEIEKQSLLDEIVLYSRVPVLETPLKHTEKREVEQKVDEALLTLPGDVRQIWLLRYKEERKYEEICEITKMPLSTIKYTLDKADKFLRKKLKELR